MTFDTQRYGSAVSQLLGLAAPYRLTPEKSVAAARDLLSQLDHAALFSRQPVSDVEMADACLAGLWLWFDFFDESHAISQNLETTTGSFWHGILHRREPDYGNAKYWFARVGRHPVYVELAAATPRVAGANEHGLTSAVWDAAKFVDLCQQASRSGGTLEELCRQVQVIEWQLLFDYSYRRALGRE